MEDEIDTAMKKFSVSGIDLAPKDARERIAAEFYARHDRAVSADLVQFDKNYTATVANLEQRLADSRKPPALNLSDPKTAQALIAWSLLLKGSTKAELLAEYEKTDDPVLLNIVETRDAARVFGLVADSRTYTADGATIPVDARSAKRLSEAVEARQTKRQDSKLTELLKTLKGAREQRMHLNYQISAVKKNGGQPILIARHDRLTNAR